MENIEDRLRKASMTGSIHELQDDSPAAAGLMSEPPILEDLKSELKEGREVDEEDEEAFEDAHEEFVESHREISPTKSQQEQVETFFFLRVALYPCNRLHSWSLWPTICYSLNTYPGMALLPPIYALGQVVILGPGIGRMHKCGFTKT